MLELDDNESCRTLLLLRLSSLSGKRLHDSTVWNLANVSWRPRTTRSGWRHPGQGCFSSLELQDRRPGEIFRSGRRGEGIHRLGRSTCSRNRNRRWQETLVVQDRGRSGVVTTGAGGEGFRRFIGRLVL